MSINQKSTVEEQYRNPMNLNTRISIHEKYSVNHQGFGNWITSHYQIENGMRVLELGCGTGSMWAGKKELVSRCTELVLSDFSEGMLCQAQKTLSEIQGIVYRTIDIQHIPYEDQSFDAVIANMMLYHVPDLQKGLAEVKRVLKKGGTFYCATYGEQGIMAYISSLFDQYGITDSSNYSFTLQNGKSQLLTFFAEVRRYDYQDALAVTNLDDMADYIYSLAGMSKLQELPREILLSVLSKHTQNGILYVPKEYGMFISK